MITIKCTQIPNKSDCMRVEYSTKIRGECGILSPCSHPYSLIILYIAWSCINESGEQDDSYEIIDVDGRNLGTGPSLFSTIESGVTPVAPWVNL